MQAHTASESSSETLMKTLVKGLFGIRGVMPMPTTAVNY